MNAPGRLLLVDERNDEEKKRLPVCTLRDVLGIKQSQPDAIHLYTIAGRHSTIAAQRLQNKALAEDPDDKRWKSKTRPFRVYPLELFVDDKKVVKTSQIVLLGTWDNGISRSELMKVSTDCVRTM